MKLYGDTETFGHEPINRGVYVYAPRAEIMLFPYAIDDGPVRVWDLTAGEPMPADLEAALLDDAVELVFHNANFDRRILADAINTNAAMRHAAANIKRWRCTMARAYAHSFPGSLDALSAIFRLGDLSKHADGKRLVLLFCKERPKSMKLRRATRETHPEDWAAFVEYARYDIVAMRELDAKLPEWNYRGHELAVWHLDQEINDRGVAVDLDFAQAAIAAVAREQERLAAEVHERTEGAVQRATERDKLLMHILEEYGVELPDMTSATIERRIADPELPPELRELLGLRLEASTTSTTKYKAFVRMTSADGRLRGSLQFCGASRTGRWAGRGVQLQNLPRPSHSFAQIVDFIDAAKAGCADLVTPDVMASAASAIRSTLIAPPGRKLVVADLSNIEGRIAAWLTGETWKLDAFRAFDAGRGPDLYVAAYARAFNVPAASVAKPQRQVGKVMELMLQYGGGVGAFVTGAATYRLDLDDLARAALSSIPFDVREEAEGFLEWTRKQRRPTFGLSDDAFVTCDALKRLWRRAHPAISSAWPALEAAAVSAIGSPGETFRVGRLVLRADGAWLRMRLPSGRYLCYFQPKVTDGEISYMGVSQYTKKWQRLSTYGGKFLEQGSQGFAGDVLKHGVVLAEADGFATVSTVHDEAISEAPDEPAYTARRLAAHLATVPAWAGGLPLAAAGFECSRYKKED